MQNVTSVCSSSAWVESTELYGSTTAFETCGAGVIANESFGLRP